MREKVILVMDKPPCCGECKMSGTGVCTKWNMKDLGTFPEDCMLKDIPKKRDLKDIEEHTGLGADYIWGEGFNACIDELLKGVDGNE